MTTWQRRKQIREERKLARIRFERQLRRNRLAEGGVHELAIVLDHLKPDFNIGKIFRSADAFGAREIYLVGIPFFDPGPGMGSFKWVPARFEADFPTCYPHLVEQGYELFALQPEGGTAIGEVIFPRRSAFIFGHEEYGLSFDPAEFPAVRPLTIPQFGRVQSLNVSVAASIVMYEYVRQLAHRRE